MRHWLNILLFVLLVMHIFGWPTKLQAQEPPRGVASVNSESTTASNGRFVVTVIGIDDYQHWPKLDNAVRDALGTAKVLIEKFGFLAPVSPLLNGMATKKQIEHLVEDKLRSALKEEDSFLLFFAGHGHTRVDRVGETEHETGFLVLVEAQAGSEEKWSHYIEIDSFLREIGTLPARHILVVLDSCHSGFALSGAHKLRSLPRYEESLRTKVSRKVVTSARRDEKAIDNGPVAGHSLFTGSLVEGLDRSLADLDDSDFITSSEIGLFLQQTVGRYSYSKQTPDFGSFYYDDRGEMVIPISIGNTLDALKRRAFSALKRGELDEVQRIVTEIVRQGSTSPQLVYLKYRVDLAGRNPEDAYSAIVDLDRMEWAEGTIPLSRHDIRENRVRVRFWRVFLGLPKGDFPLDVTFFAGAERDKLKLTELTNIGNFKGYEIKTGDYIRLEIGNPMPNTWHVYMIDIDQDGRVNPVALWDSDTQFEGLSAGNSERSYLFKHDGSAPGLSEFRLFASPRGIPRLISPPSAAARAGLSALDESDATGVKVKSLVYRAVLKDVLSER